MHCLAVASIDNHLLAPDAVVLLSKLELVHNLCLKEACITGFYNLNLTHHLAYDNFEVLVVDLYTLQTVYVLNLVNDVLLNCGGTLDGKDIGRSDGTVRQRSTGTNVVVVLYQNLLGDGHKVLANVTNLRGDGNLAVTALETTHGNNTVDFGNNSRIAGVTCLEQLSYTRQTTGNITATTYYTRYLDKDFTHTGISTVHNGDMATDGEVIGTQDVAVLVQDVTSGNLVAVLRFNDDVLALLCSLVGLHAICYVLDNVLELNLTSRLCYDNRVEGIPLSDYIALLYDISLVLKQGAAIRYILSEQYYTSLRFNKANFGQTTHDNLIGTIVSLCLYSTKFLKFQTSLVLCLNLCIGNGITCHTTGMESTQSQLSTRLTDRLGCDNTHGLALVNHAA